MNNNNLYKFTFVYPDFEYSKTSKGVSITEGGWYSEGIAQLASIIEKNGWNVELLHYTKPVSKEKFLNDLYKSNPTIIGFSVRTGVWRKAKEMINWSSKLGKYTIIGSYHPTLWPNEVIKWRGVDAICIGEGENPIKQLVRYFPSMNKVYNIKSLWFNVKKGKNCIIKKNDVCNIEHNLDSLPLPKFDIFNFSKLLSSKIKSATIILTRGCPFTCTYCWNNFARNLYPNKHQYVRFRSPENSINLIKNVLRIFPELKSFRFQDDLWPFWTDWFDKFYLLYKKEINLPFECHLRAELLNENIIKKLKDINCKGIYFGVESGNDFIRNKILKRNQRKEDIINAFDLCHKYKIRTHSYNIFGIPHENMIRALDTIKLNARLAPTDMFYFIFFPYAGTELSNLAIKHKFFDPRKPLDPIVNIEMPDFKKDQIRFASLYGRLFTRIYQMIFKLPKYLRSLLEKLFDFLWTYPKLPFKILNLIMLSYRKMEEKAKVFIKENMFWLYLKLKK